MPRKRGPPTVEIGLGGLKQYSGRIYEEFHPKLRGPKGAAIFEEMRDNDPVVGSVLYSVEAYLRQVKWRAEAADTSPEAQKEADFLTSCMGDMESPWEEFISDVLSFLVYGFSLHETVYKIRVGPSETNPRYRSAYDDSRFGWRCHALRPQTTINHWDIEVDSGVINGAIQYSPTSGATLEAYLPMNRCLLFRTKTYKNNPEGRSVLRNAYRPWYFKKRLEEIEAIGASRDLSGMPVVEMPVALMAPNASAAQKAVRSTMESLVSQIHRDEREGIVFPAELDGDGKPTGYKLKLLSSPGGKQVPADPIIRRYDSRIVMSMAAEFLMLGTEKQGSFALGAEKSSNFIRSLAWFTQTIAATLNKVAVQRLYDVNNVPQKLRAKIVPSDLDVPDLKELGLFLQQAGASEFLHPTLATENAIREIAHLPAVEDLGSVYQPGGDGGLKPPPTPPPAPPGAPTPGAPKPGAPLPKGAPKKPKVKP